MGSKNRIAKHILPIMLKYRTPEMTWVEPFVGETNDTWIIEGNGVRCSVRKNTTKSKIKKVSGDYVLR